MNKPISREKLLKELTSYNYILENHLSNLVKSINAGRFDEDAPAFDVDELLDWCDNNVESVNGITDRNYIPHDRLERFIESKLKKEPEVQKEDEIMSAVKGVRKTLPVEMCWTYCPDCKISAQILYGKTATHICPGNIPSPLEDKELCGSIKPTMEPAVNILVSDEPFHCGKELGSQCITIDGPVTYGAINSVDQYQNGIENKNLIDADELVKWSGGYFATGQFSGEDVKNILKQYVKQTLEEP